MRSLCVYLDIFKKYQIGFWNFKFESIWFIKVETGFYFTRTQLTFSRKLLILYWKRLFIIIFGKLTSWHQYYIGLSSQLKLFKKITHNLTWAYNIDTYNWHILPKCISKYSTIMIMNLTLLFIFSFYEIVSNYILNLKHSSWWNLVICISIIIIFISFQIFFFNLTWQNFFYWHLSFSKKNLSYKNIHAF